MVKKMVKANVKVGGSKVSLEGSPEEVKKLLELISVGGSELKSIKPRMAGEVDSKKPAKPGKASITDHLVELTKQGFFDKPKEANAIKGKLAELGYHYAGSSLTDPLKRAVRSKLLGRLKTNEGVWGYAKR